MKKVILILIFLLPSFFLFSQNKNTYLPEKKHKKGYDFNDYIEKPREEMYGWGWDLFSISYGYHQSTILNPTFVGLIHNKKMKRAYGQSFTVRATYYPFLFDMKWFSSRFKPIDMPNWQYYSDAKIKHRGFEISSAIAIMPINLEISHILIPYIGIGYQSSNLAITQTEGTGEDAHDVTKSATPTSAPIWKIGFTINLINKLTCSTEYSQTFKLSSKKSFNQFMITFGYLPYSSINY